MPRQVDSLEDFKRQLAKATDCKVVRRGESVKIKLRTKGTLWTYVVDAAEADKVLGEVKIPINEF